MCQILKSIHVIDEPINPNNILYYYHQAEIVKTVSQINYEACIVAIGNLVESILHQMSDFWGIQVTHVRRQGNCSAHLLAQHAKDIDGYIAWIKENFIFIKSALIQNVMNLSSL